MKIIKVSGVAFIFFVLLFSSASFAQLSKVPNLKLYDYDQLRFGFILAANQMNFVVTPKENLSQIYFTGSSIPEGDLASGNIDSVLIYGIQSLPAMGFSVGIVGNLRLGDYFDLRFIPTLSFGSRSLQYDGVIFVKQDDGSKKEESRSVLKKINSTFVQFPLYLKYKSKRVHNMRAYVFGGLKFSFDLASQANKTELNNYDPKLYRSDMYGVIGTGFDIYMNWFKLGIELSMEYGTRDILLREGNIFTDSIEALKSKIFMLTFTFE